MRTLALPALPLLLLLVACNQADPAPEPREEQVSPAAQAEAAPAAQPADTAGAPADTAPLFGLWSADLGRCDTAGVRISATSFEGAENVCDITGLADNGDGSFTASLACVSEGQQVEERIRMTPVFAPSGEGVTLDYLDRGGEPVTLLRCD